MTQPATAPDDAQTAALAAPDAALTPMLAQWREAKAAHPDCLIFFRVGDFYELFFDDARHAAQALDIALTKRGSHDGQPIAMAGVPVAAAEQYLPRLIRAGHRVAICEQLEDPAEARKRSGRALVRRAVVRVVTPGTLTEDGLLEARRSNWLAALAEAGGDLGLAWLDLSTGEVWLQPLPAASGPAGPVLAAALARIAPGELLVPDRLFARAELAAVMAEAATTPLPAARFDSTNGRRRLEKVWGVAALDAFGAFERAEIAAAGALVDYVALTQADRLPPLARPRRLPPPGGDGAVMEIDPATRRNLELAETLAGQRQGALLATVDRTVTAAGARLLAARLAAPATDPAEIDARLDMVDAFVRDSQARDDIRAALRGVPDLERAMTRLALGRGGPRDLAALRDGLATTAGLRGRAGGLRVPLPARLGAARDGLGEHGALVGTLQAALAAELPLLLRDGGFVAAGHDAALDDQRALRNESTRLVAGLQATYVAQTGVAALKIRHNNVLGYFIEVTAAHAEKLMDEPGRTAGFRHRQTMASAARFTTDELATLEDRISRAGERALAREQEIFAELAAAALARAEPIADAARAVAELDLATALADLAASRRWCRPAVDAGGGFVVTGGRHPVVEAALERCDGTFVPNDCTLAAGETGTGARLWLLTGPNMAGKSTFLRQNALIAVLAQAGSFVPAATARIGVVDRLFSRVGAADDLARGRSTFMVEMVETATILNQAGPRSLVILDEIGRGTATFDGLSIAWATVEHLHDTNRCRTLFATHFHELTALAGRLPGLACHSMRVREWRGEVVFLHEVAAGTADRSYGVHVARLAGLPAPVLARAEEVLAMLERGEEAGALKRLAEELPLFRAAARPASPPANVAEAGPSALERRLAAINPDELTPRAALDLLYELRALSDGRDA